MQRVQEPIETIHLYVVRENEEPPRPSLLPLALSTLLLLAVVAVGVFFPSQQPEIRTTLRLPAVFLPLKTLTASVAIIPTGMKVYPATTARGILTLTNGSVITQELPPGMIFTGSGVEVITDEVVLVPAGNAEGFGVATVSAHSLLIGKKGNIAALSINQVYGTSLFIRNLSPFTGGNDSHSVQVVTAKDRQNAITFARASLTAQVAHIQAILAQPCRESAIGNNVLLVAWICQFIAYPHMCYTAIRLRGKNLFVTVVSTPRPRRIWVK